MVRFMTLFMVIAMLVTGCNNIDTPVDKSELSGDDYRLFQGTPAWNLAKAVKNEDVDQIKMEVAKNKGLLRYRDPRFGAGLLAFAVASEKYESVKALLVAGADPNMQDLDIGKSPLMLAVSMGYIGSGANSRILKLLLRYGGDPNAEENGPVKQGSKETPLIIACSNGNLEYIKILVDAGANINATNGYGAFALQYATISAQIFESPELVIFLIDKGADFKRPLYKTLEGENKYITDDLRDWLFDLGSDAYKKKMQLVAFLKKNGMDYWKTPIQKEYFNDYPKEYLQKY